MMKLTIAGAASLVLVACTSPQQEASRLVALDANHFANSITVKDDALETVVTFSTEPGFQIKQGLLGIVWEDTFLRGYIHKKTKVRSYQVYQFLMYRGPNWRFYTRVNYETPSGGPKSVGATKIHSDVDCTGSRYQGCRYEEHIGFSVDEALLRQVANKYAATRGQMVGWRFKVKARAGQDYQGVITAAEIKGLLDRMDRYAQIM